MSRRVAIQATLALIEDRSRGKLSSRIVDNTLQNRCCIASPCWVYRVLGADHGTQRVLSRARDGRGAGGDQRLRSHAACEPRDRVLRPGRAVLQSRMADAAGRTFLSAKVVTALVDVVMTETLLVNRWLT